MATIADVCKEAGVSKATVSRVLNHTGQVTLETRNKVFAAIKKLDYRPNSLAQALATNKTNTIGLIVPAFEGAHYGSLLTQAAASCEAAGKQLFVTDGHNDPQREKDAILMLKDRRCDAIILYSRLMTESTILDMIDNLDVPLIVVNRKFSTCKIPCITFDQYGAGEMITKYLLTLGHQNIACITGTPNTTTGEDRLLGYKSAIERFGIPYKESLVECGNFNFFGGYEAGIKILERNPDITAIFACNDEMAVGIEKALIESGKSIPDQVSVVGIDNSRLSSYAHVPLTTVHIPVKEMMSCAIEMALEMIANPDQCPEKTRFVGEIIERSSAAHANSR